MSHFRLLGQGNDFSRVLAELNALPELWDVYKKRGIEDERSPHCGVSDIWVRYRAEEDLTEPKDFIEPFRSVFWPSWKCLPSLHPIVRNLPALINVALAHEGRIITEMGAILITRIPPGGQVKPHIDAGWHAETFDFKAYLCLQGNPMCLNWVEDEPFSPRAGDVFEFSNQKMHSVANHGPMDRITAIICFRTEGT